MEPSEFVQDEQRAEPQRPRKRGRAPRRPARSRGQLSSVRDALRALVQGDFSIRLPLRADGLGAEVARAFNALAERNQALARELDRVSRAVSTEGHLRERCDLGRATGDWEAVVDSVNDLVEGVTFPVAQAIRVLDSVAQGDLSSFMPTRLDGQELQGELGRLAATVNTVVLRLRAVSSGISHVVRQIGAEGRLGDGAPAIHDELAGTWKALLEEVNVLSMNLTAQVRSIAGVSAAIAQGDLSKKVTVETRGEFLELRNAINATVDRLRSFASEVIRVAREVGSEGVLGGQADVKGVSGVWQELTGAVNRLARNLTDQVRNIALVTTAVAKGDLSQKISVEAKGEILALKDTVNGMVDQLRTFAAEVTRVAREVGTEGRLGGQAEVRGVSGTWRELTESVNVMARNLTSQVRGIARVVTAVATGDLSQTLVLDARGEIAALADTINDMSRTLAMFADQVTTVAREVGIEGKLGGQARVSGASGTWRVLTDNVNMLAGNLTTQVRNIARVSTAIAAGDLTKKITVEAKGELLDLKDTINAMVDQLTVFAAEVIRVAREVGTEGQLGGQARVPGVSGTWKDLTDQVNVMASHLTDQVRGISRVVTSVANGDLSRVLRLEAKGEIAQLAETINEMTATLRVFADQVTTMAREVGIEGRFGGKAPGAEGIWKDLSEAVNKLAANLTTQVREISEVAKAVTQGDLTRTITVEARGEILSLKNIINQMIANLRQSTYSNKEQDWLKSNLTHFFTVMQGRHSLESLAQRLMAELAPAVGALHGAFFIVESSETRPVLRLVCTYAHTRRKRLVGRLELGETLVGQCALEKKPIIVSDAPEDFVEISSGLGHAPPRSIAVFPVLFEGEVQGVVELASFHPLTPIQLTFLEQLMLNVGVAVNLVGASMRTEELLRELRESNASLEEKARLLELRNREIADTSAELKEKAWELAKVSQYKSQFLANMSHEIRTPLNSMMTLAQLLQANEEKNLTARQQEFAELIDASGRDLLVLINQILDLSRVEAGRIEVHMAPASVEDVVAMAERTFRPIASQKKVEFEIHVAPGTVATLTTDRQLLHQILKNLLSNAFKFTEKGRVELKIFEAPPGTRYRTDALGRAPGVLAFAVSDTGPGIAPEHQELIFEAFQQADASITRKFGGTGLGLTISREYARVLEGEISLQSALGQGSTFTLYLPITPEDRRARAAPADPGRSEEVNASAAVPETAAELAGRRLLVVEDDPRNLYATTALLEAEQAVVFPASSARQAFSVLDQHSDIELVLMDIMMPEVDGYEATRQLKARKGFEHLPVIAFSAKVSASDRDQALAAGCDEFVVKPATRRELLEVIGRWLRRS